MRSRHSDQQTCLQPCELQPYVCHRCCYCVQEEELLIKPAVMGTENVLTCVNATPSVQRVVVTSSTAAVFTDGTERGRDYVFTEADWNMTATPQKFPYFYSKKMAELVSTAAAGNVQLCLSHGVHASRMVHVTGSQAFSGRWQLVSFRPLGRWVGVDTCMSFSNANSAGQSGMYLCACLLGCSLQPLVLCMPQRRGFSQPVCWCAVSLSCSVQWRCARRLAAGGSW